MDSELDVVTADVFRGVETVVAITDTGGLVINFAGAEVDSFVVTTGCVFVDTSLAVLLLAGGSVFTVDGFRPRCFGIPGEIAVVVGVDGSGVDVTLGDEDVLDGGLGELSVFDGCEADGLEVLSLLVLGFGFFSFSLSLSNFNLGFSFSGVLLLSNPLFWMSGQNQNFNKMHCQDKKHLKKRS